MGSWTEVWNEGGAWVKGLNGGGGGDEGTAEGRRGATGWATGWADAMAAGAARWNECWAADSTEDGEAAGAGGVELAASQRVPSNVTTKSAVGAEGATARDRPGGAVNKAAMSKSTEGAS